MIDNTQTIVLIYHQVRRVEVAVAEDARTGGQLGGNVIELRFKLRGFRVAKCFVP